MTDCIGLAREKTASCFGFSRLLTGCGFVGLTESDDDDDDDDDDDEDNDDDDDYDETNTFENSGRTAAPTASGGEFELACNEDFNAIEIP